MKYFNPANLAVIACPGGESFADEVIEHLRSRYRHSRKQVISDIARRYSISAEQAELQIDLINKIGARGSASQSGSDKTNGIKVAVKFTQFPN